MPVSGIALRAIRTDFYNEVKAKYETTNEEIARVLINAGFEEFRAEERKQYMVILDAFFNQKEVVKQKIKEATEHAGDWKKTTLGVKETYPCPIIGCTGHKVFHKGNSRDWKCTAGGETHYYAMRLAKIWKYLHQDDISIEEKATELAKAAEEGRNGKEQQDGSVK